MRRTIVVRVLAVVTLALLLAGPAVAQDKATVIAAGWAPAAEFDNSGNTFLPLGATINASFPVHPNISILGDIGWQHKGGVVDVVQGIVGVRYWVPMQGKNQALPFVEGGVGVGFVGPATNGVPNQTGFALGFGGGVDIPVPNKPLGIRIQVNYFRISAYGGVNEVRFGVGISGKLGGK